MELLAEKARILSKP